MDVNGYQDGLALSNRRVAMNETKLSRAKGWLATALAKPIGEKKQIERGQGKGRKDKTRNRTASCNAMQMCRVKL